MPYEEPVPEPLAEDSQSTDEEITHFHELIAQIEHAAPPFAISGLQRRRTEIGALSRKARSIFGGRPPVQDWAFHFGGRGELQFNVGIDRMPDGRRAFRTGVAFSLQPSRSMPDIARLEPRIAWFNAWLREHPEELQDLSMWHFYGDRSADYAVGPIPEQRIQRGTFIFVGDRQLLWAVDVHRALRVMDRLLPLWEFVESRRDVAIGKAVPFDGEQDLRREALRLDSGRGLDSSRWTTATTRERTFDVYLRHEEIQRRLKAELLVEGCTEVIFEPLIGTRRIDVVARFGQALWFYEVKTGSTDRACLREGIGQLLEYALWPGATRPQRLVVVGEPPLTPNGQAYLVELNRAFPIPLHYRQLSLG